MTSGTGRHGGPAVAGDRGRFSEHAKSVAAILTGIAALLTAVAGTITLVCSDPEGNPASAVTTTVVGVQDTADGRREDGISPPAADTDVFVPLDADSSPSQQPPADTPVPQWQGDVQVDSLGYSLTTVPPSHDQSGDPDISAAFDGTFFATLGAAEWTSTATPSPKACATLILAQNATHMIAVLGDMYCMRVAHSPDDPRNQYAAVRIVGQGRDATDFPYVRIHAMVWPDER